MALYLLAFTLFLPFHRSPPPNRSSTLPALISGFEARGVQVEIDHPRCSDRNLHGFYSRGSRHVVICQRGDQSYTLRHEGWHLVQALCLLGQQWLTSTYVEDRLSQQDRTELRLFVNKDSWTREAEARVIAQLPPDPYFNAVDAACSLHLEDSDRDMLRMHLLPELRE
jgi:hypothetical protein